MSLSQQWGCTDYNKNLIILAVLTRMYHSCPDFHMIYGLIQIYIVSKKDIGETINSHVLPGF
jgi:hypothetical protein